MKRTLALLTILLAFFPCTQAMAAAPPLEHSLRYTGVRSPSLRAAASLDAYLRAGRAPDGRPYVSSGSGPASLVVGKQSYTPGNGLVAGLYGVCGVKTSFAGGAGRATFFYGDAGQPVMAGDVAVHKQDNLILEASYFKTDSAYAGLAVSRRWDKQGAVSVETSENLNTQAKGYLIQVEYGQVRRRGDVYASLAYRYVEPGAVSGYSADAGFDDSKGVRLEATYKLKDDVALTVQRDFAETQESFDKSAVSATLVWNF